MKHLLLCLLAPLVTAPALAQTSYTLPVKYSAELQGELAFKNGDYLLLTYHDENNHNYSVLPFSNRQMGAVAYEHFWNDRWSGGGSLHYANSGFTDFIVPGLLLRHRGPLGSLVFGQRLALSRIYPRFDGSFADSELNETWVSLRFDLEKLILLGSGRLALRPRLSYEAATHFRLQKADDAINERFIQSTNLRAEVGLRISPHFDLTPWVAYQTNYFITLPQFNGMGVQVSGGKVNDITPALGLDARFTLFQGKAAFDRKQLPTQH